MSIIGLYTESAAVRMDWATLQVDADNLFLVLYEDSNNRLYINKRSGAPAFGTSDAVKTYDFSMDSDAYVS